MTTLALTVANLPNRARQNFEAWRDVIEPLLNRPSGPGLCAEIERAAQQFGVPSKTLMRRYYAAKRHGLHVLIDKRLAGTGHWNSKTQAKISPADQELVKLYCGKNQRSSRSGIKQLRRDFINGRVKTETPIDPATRLPRGWSTGNLCRYLPNRFELKSVRIGRTAAASERPLVYTTRKGLYVGSHYMLDDMWHDFFVNSFVEKQAGRPLELFSHDLFSARKVRWGIRVRTRKDDGSYNQLTEQMTRMILAATLFLDGYSPRGTKIVAEHGTAAVREGVERALHEMSEGQITISRSGMTGAAAHAGQYPGISRGNFRHKASLESGNNLTHNVFAALPGQTGKDVAHRPEELGAMLNHNRDLLAAREQILSASVAAVYDRRADLLQYPILELTQFHSVAHELYAAIEDDPDHELNDWVECGHVVNEVHIGGQWIDQQQLPPAVIASLYEAINSGALETRPRKMTRGEVWRAGKDNLIHIPGYGVCAILGDDLAVPRKVAGNRFEFNDQEVGPGVHRYHAVAKTPHGEELRLADRETYETFVNPFAPETLFVRRGNGAYIGECRRIEKPCRADVEGVHRACGAAAKAEAELLAPVRVRHLQDARDKTARHVRNSAVLSGKPLAFAERCQAIAEAERVTSIGEFLEEEAPVISTDPIASAEDFL